MLAERLSELFLLLQCSNSDIARFADCSPSNISRLKSGTREPDPGSRAIARLARGIYRYADYENMLDVLTGLCGTEDTRADVLVPSIINWLYETREYKLPQPVTPKSKQEKINRQQSFSDRLNKIMTMLDYSNSRLAADLNVDSSLISRYRTGIYHPNRNLVIRRHLTELLLSRAEKTGHLEDLAAACSMAPEELDPETFAEWLYEQGENRKSEIAESIFYSIDSFDPGASIPLSVPEIPEIQIADRYWGTTGIRNAVIRFLADAAAEGGDLLLFSDEPMDWMSGDSKFFQLWACLMTACLQKGVHIKIIHNVDWDGQEMVSAIRAWLPLYISGNIEPYLFRKMENPRFHHTIFLRPEGEGILGFYPAGAEEQRWYDYITDKARLDTLQSGFNTMAESASPFLKTYPAYAADGFWARYYNHSGKANTILRGLSAATMPEALLEKMLSRIEISGQKRESVINFHQAIIKHLRKILENGSLHELLCLSNPNDVIRGGVYVNFDAETNGLCLTYTPEDYAAHISAIKDLVMTEKNYHLTLLPHAPFRALQVFTMKDGGAVLRNQKPYTAFVFSNPILMRSVDDYCDMLTKQYGSDRSTIIRELSLAGAVVRSEKEE